MDGSAAICPFLPAGLGLGLAHGHSCGNSLLRGSPTKPHHTLSGWVGGQRGGTARSAPRIPDSASRIFGVLEHSSTQGTQNGAPGVRGMEASGNPRGRG